MKPAAWPVLLALVAVAGALGLPAVPYRATSPTTAGDLRVCTAGETTYRLDAGGLVRSVEYARLIPDNILRVRQSYDRAGGSRARPCSGRGSPGRCSTSGARSTRAAGW